MRTALSVWQTVGESAGSTASYGLADRYVGESTLLTASYGLTDRYIGESARLTASYGLRSRYGSGFERLSVSTVCGTLTFAHSNVRPLPKVCKTVPFKLYGLIFIIQLI